MFVHQLLWYLLTPLPPTASNSLGTKTPENTAKDTGDPVPADEGDIQIEYYSD